MKKILIIAALALLNTQVAAAAGLGAWLLVERYRDGHATSLGAASGAVAGLVVLGEAVAGRADGKQLGVRVMGEPVALLCADSERRQQRGQEQQKSRSAAGHGVTVTPGLPVEANPGSRPTDHSNRSDARC